MFISSRQMGTRASHHWHDTQGNNSTLPATQQRTSFSPCKSINGAKKTNSQKDPLMAHCSFCFSFLSPLSNFWKSVNQTTYQQYLQTNHLPPTPSPTSFYHTMTIYRTTSPLTQTPLNLTPPPCKKICQNTHAHLPSTLCPPPMLPASPLTDG